MSGGPTVHSSAVTCPLLGLPLESRCEIYRFVFEELSVCVDIKDARFPSYNRSKSLKGHPGLGLIAVSRQIRHEAEPELFANAAIEFYGLQSYRSLRRVLRAQPEHMRHRYAKIQHLRGDDDLLCYIDTRRVPWKLKTSTRTPDCIFPQLRKLTIRHKMRVYNTQTWPAVGEYIQYVRLLRRLVHVPKVSGFALELRIHVAECDPHNRYVTIIDGQAEPISAPRDDDAALEPAILKMMEDLLKINGRAAPETFPLDNECNGLDLGVLLKEQAAR